MIRHLQKIKKMIDLKSKYFIISWLTSPCKITKIKTPLPLNTETVIIYI